MKTYGWKKILTEGREVGVEYSPKTQQVFLHFSRRLTSEVMEECRSISDLNRKYGANFILSKNRKSLLSVVALSIDSAKVLGELLRKTFHNPVYS